MPRPKVRPHFPAKMQRYKRYQGPQFPTGNRARRKKRTLRSTMSRIGAHRYPHHFRLRRSLHDVVTDQLDEEQHLLYYQRVFIVGRNRMLSHPIVTSVGEDEMSFTDLYVPSDCEECDDTIDDDTQIEYKNTLFIHFRNFIHNLNEWIFGEERLTGALLVMDNYSLLIVEGADQLVRGFLKQLLRVYKEFWQHNKILLFEDHVEHVYFQVFIARRIGAMHTNEKFPQSMLVDEELMARQYFLIMDKLHGLCELLAPLAKREKRFVTRKISLPTMPNANVDEPLEIADYIKFLPEIERIEMIFKCDMYFRSLGDLGPTCIRIPHFWSDSMETWPLEFQYVNELGFDRGKHEYNLTFGEYFRQANESLLERQRQKREARRLAEQLAREEEARRASEAKKAEDAAAEADDEEGDEDEDEETKKERRRKKKEKLAQKREEEAAAAAQIEEARRKSLDDDDSDAMKPPPGVTVKPEDYGDMPATAEDIANMTLEELAGAAAPTEDQAGKVDELAHSISQQMDALTAKESDSISSSSEQQDISAVTTATATTATVSIATATPSAAATTDTTAPPSEGGYSEGMAPSEMSEYTEMTEGGEYSVEPSLAQDDVYRQADVSNLPSANESMSATQPEAPHPTPASDEDA